MVGTSGFSWAVVGRFLKQVTAGLLEPSSEGVLLGFRTAAPSPTQPRKLEGKRGLLTPTCFLTHLGGGGSPPGYLRPLTWGEGGRCLETSRIKVSPTEHEEWGHPGVLPGPALPHQSTPAVCRAGCAGSCPWDPRRAEVTGAPRRGAGGVGETPPCEPSVSPAHRYRKRLRGEAELSPNHTARRPLPSRHFRGILRRAGGSVSYSLPLCFPRGPECKGDP